MNWTGSIAKYFIENGKLTAIILLGLFIWGVFSFTLTPKKYNPTIVAPAFKVSVSMPGTTRDEVMEQVTKPLERVISDIAGVEDLFSVTTQGGHADVFVNFYVGEDLDSAKIALNDRLQSDLTLAPLGIATPLVESLDPEDVPIMTLSLSSGQLNEVELRKMAFEVRDQLGRIEGASRIFVVGGRKRELRVEVDPEKLETYALSVQQIADALKLNNTYLSAGLMKGLDLFTPVEVNARLHDPREVEEVIVVTNNTIDIKVKDLARVYESQEEIESYVIHNDFRSIQTNEAHIKNTVLISLSKLRGTNISDVTDRVLEKVEHLKLKLPNTVELEVLVNDGHTARDEINGLMMNLFTSITIVIVILFLFLSAKASVLVAVSIPLTLASVFGLAYLAGQDINRITLFALILSLGLLVDNATVVIENIVRHVRAHKKVTTETFVLAVSEVGPGLFMATITTVLAFLPMNYISGMMGPYMGPIPFFVPAALFCALVISFSINPWMASVLLKGEQVHHQHNKRPNFLQSSGSVLLFKYRQLIRGLMVNSFKRRVTLTMIVLFILSVMTFPVFQLVKFRMLPKANVDQFYLYLDLVEGSPLNQTYELSQKLVEKLKESPEVTMVQSYVGVAPILDFNGLFKAVSNRRYPHQATLRVGLLPDDQRDLTSERLVIKLRQQLNQILKSTPGAVVKLIEDPPGPPVMSTLQLKVQADNEQVLEREATALMPMFKNISGSVDHDMTLASETEDLLVTVDHLACSRSKVAPGQVVDTLNAFYRSRVAGVYHRENLHEQEFITLRIKPELRENEEFLKNLTVINALRISIPLSELTKIERVKTVVPAWRENHRQTIYLNAEMGERSVTYAGIDLLSVLYDYKLSDGQGSRTSWNLFGLDFVDSTGEEVKLSLGGEWELTLEVFRDLMIAMAIAILAIYLVLVAQFKSFMDALLIMSTIPLSLAGVMPGFALMNLLTGEFFTATSMIGVIALAGIAVNNAIILLEYINSLKGKEIELVEALVEACATRLRPIALTTITTVLGSMTIVSDPVWSGLAWAIIWGLAVSSMLILIVFPLLYYATRLDRWQV